MAQQFKTASIRHFRFCDSEFGTGAHRFRSGDVRNMRNIRYVQLNKIASVATATVDHDVAEEVVVHCIGNRFIHTQTGIVGTAADCSVFPIGID